MSDTIKEELLARLRGAEEKAWWRDMTGLVEDKDQQLVVIGPRSDATADDLRSLGEAIERWKAEFPRARHRGIQHRKRADSIYSSPRSLTGENGRGHAQPLQLTRRSIF